MSTTASSIPVVDFSSLSLNQRDDELAEAKMKITACEMMNAFCAIGFVYLSNTGFPDQLLTKATNVADQFFDLPLSSKQRCMYARASTDNHGWISSEQEFANPSRPGDLKECFNVNLELESTAKWPSDEVPDFKQVTMEFVEQCRELSYRVLLAMAYGLSLPDKSYFRRCHNKMTEPGNPSVLRLLRYPPLPPAEDIKPNQVRLGEHCDYGSITLLFQLDSEGLQVQKRGGEWIDAIPIPNTVLINIGDLMQRWTSDKLISTPHRVMIPDDETKRQKIRRSIAFFVHPDHDVTVGCLDGSDKYPPVNGTEYLNTKLNATYLY